MPTYDYKCRDCGHAFERFQSITADKLEICPKCGGRLERLIGAGAGLLFKGSGFYITDYRSTSYRKSAKAETGSADSTTKTGTAGNAGADGTSKPAGTSSGGAAGSSSGSGSGSSGPESSGS